jgi:hypothetical protein
MINPNLTELQKYRIEQQRRQIRKIMAREQDRRVNEALDRLVRQRQKFS